MLDMTPLGGLGQTTSAQTKNVRAGLNLLWVHMLEGTFSDILDHMLCTSKDLENPKHLS